MEEVKYVRSEVMLVIRITSYFPVVDCYQTSIIFFVHVHMKQSCQRSQKSQEAIHVTNEYIIMFTGGFFPTFPSLRFHRAVNPNQCGRTFEVCVYISLCNMCTE
jgi:hypothetical protein